MRRSPIFLDSFSGALSDLKPANRTISAALRTLAESPRVSTFDRSEYRWINDLLRSLIDQGLIVEVAEAYPWHRYALTDAGKEAIKCAT